ncbi:MAG: phosphate/phosphite/phosphonate ABC transporter substrate-binding protein [Coriobacteriia bacterium]
MRWSLPHRLVTVALVASFAAGAICGCAGTPRLRVDLERRAVGAVKARRAGAPATIKVGFDPRLDPYEEARIYAPFLAYLHRATGREFELRFTKKSESIVDNLGRGVVDVAFVGAVSFVRAQDRYGARCLARGINAVGEDNYRAAIVVRPDSPVRELADLMGRSFAFGAESSTQGHLIPEIMLLDAGVRDSDLGDWEFTGSHQACAEAVSSGRYDAGGLQDTLAGDLAKEGLLRIVAFSGEYPTSGLAVRAGFPTATAEAIQRALVAFRPAGRDRAGLYHWERTEMPRGFVAAGPRDYDVVETALRRLDMLGDEEPLP